MNAAPLVSICLPNLNTRPYLAERMETVLAQTLGDWELIVCDSYSDDGAWEFFQKFASDPRVSLHQVPRRGAYAGWNECLRRARGRYVYVATSDDTMEPHCLEELVSACESQPSAALAMCEYFEIDENGGPLPSRMTEQRRLFKKWADQKCRRPRYWELLFQIVAGISWQTITAVLFRRDLLDRIGCFREDLGDVADFHWALAASVESDFVYVPQVLASWRRHPRQISNISAARATWQRVRCVREFLAGNAQHLPAQWTSQPAWKVRMIEPLLRLQREYSDLFLHVLREKPSRFFEAVGYSLKTNPRWLLEQLCRGFRYDADAVARTTEEEAMRELRAAFPCDEPTLIS
ncbi:MAG: glycosyltransferase [Chthoniobacteraceae bacterium]